MDINDFKHIVGEAKPNEVATIKFFGGVNEERSRAFISEFDYLESYVKPSKIRVLINCEGGSVLHGMGVYSTISNSTIPTECINEGIAASMGSVIWAAGNISYMRDYSFLMIHCPFVPKTDKDSEPSELVKAFTKQIESIYCKRFGMKKKQVVEIMKGEPGKDGTFFDAESAVKAGIIPESNVIITSKQIRDKVKNEINGIEDALGIQEAISKISCEIECDIEENKPSTDTDTNLNQNQNPTEVENKLTKTKRKKMDDRTIELSAVAASLGMGDAFEMKDVMARISNLLQVEAKLETAQKDLNDARTIIAGKETAIENIQATLANVNAELSVYKEKEACEKSQRVESLVQDAIDCGKIKAEAKQQWIDIAGSNFELAQATLESIPERDKITDVIAKDPANVAAAADAMIPVEEKLQQVIDDLVGPDFEFKTLN